MKLTSGLLRVLADVERHGALIRGTQGPLEELRRAFVVDPAFELYEQCSRIQDMMDAFNARLILPEVPYAVKLMEKYRQSLAAEKNMRLAGWAKEIHLAMEAMRTPWLDTQETLRSVKSFVEIQGIGGMLERMPSFKDTVSATLREALGDWRDKITWSEPVLTDLSVRGAFYVDLGFDPSLTDFPAPAFQECTKIAGLRRDPPPLVSAYGEPVPRAQDDEEEALIRTNAAHDWLLRFETSLRRFIDARMTAVFGPHWPKHQLPNGVYEQWMTKREAAVKAGRESKPLVAYADFSDYERLICKRDNWRQVFSSYFGRRESVRESFQRLHPIRLDTMHARPIGQDDELLLYVEIQRFARIISASTLSPLGQCRESLSTRD